MIQAYTNGAVEFFPELKEASGDYALDSEGNYYEEHPHWIPIPAHPSLKASRRVRYQLQEFIFLLDDEIL